MIHDRSKQDRHCTRCNRAAIVRRIYSDGGYRARIRDRDLRKVMRINSRGVIIADDPASPFNLSTQDCSGSLVVGANGKPMIESGFCQAIDRDGDTWSLWYENGAAGNIWKVIGGTGKYLKMTGGGTTKELFTSLNGRETVLHWDGSWQR